MWHTMINETAPVVAKQQLLIHAPVETVWNVLTSINDWPKWQSTITQAQLKGAVREGTVFVWKAGGLNFTSKIHTCQPFDFFGWTGKTIGASAIHNWMFKKQGESTLVFIEESMQGFFPSIMKKKFNKDLEKGMRRNLEELKSASEKAFAAVSQ